MSSLATGRCRLAARASGYLAAMYALRRSGSSWASSSSWPGWCCRFSLSANLAATLVTRRRPLASTHYGDALQPSFGHIVLLTSFKDSSLSACSQAGMVNNLEPRTGQGTLPAVLRVHRP